MTAKVPLLDLKPQYQALKQEIDAAVQKVVDSQYFILGPEVEAMEREVAAYCGSGHCVGVSSGTDALLLSLMALEVGPGDEVVTTPFTFFATAGAISRVGATPVFVDVEPETYNIAPELIEEKLTPNTKAIVPVHLFGRCAAMDAVCQIADAYRIPVIEDAAQAIGSECNGKRAGAMGRLGCFSFFPSKNLGAFGDAGAVTTSDSELYEKLVSMRVHGGKSKYYYDRIGGNFRLDALQAAVLRVKLRHLDSWTEGRQRNAAYYSDQLTARGLADVVSVPKVTRDRHIFNQYTLRVADRDALRQALIDAGVGCEVYYPVPLHLQDCFRDLGYKTGDFPVSELAAKQVLSLPIYPELSQQQLETVVNTIVNYYRGATSQRRAA